MGKLPTISYATPPSPGSAGRGGRSLWLLLLIPAAVIGGAGVLLIVLGSLFWPGFNLGVDTESLTPQQVEQIGEFKLPPGATNLKAHYVAFQDFSLHVRFAIPPDQLDTLIDSTHIARPLSTTQIPSAFSPFTSDKSWWTPGQPTKFLAGEYNSLSTATTVPTTKPTIFQNILIDQTNPKQYIVWMIVHDT